MAFDLVGEAQSILTDSDSFGQSVTVTAPDETAAALTGFAAEIGQDLDPETGAQVAGARASIALPIVPFRAAFGDTVLPENVRDGSGRPWIVAFDDAGGTSRTYKVIDVMPDLRMGVITCLLEAYRP